MEHIKSLLGKRIRQSGLARQVSSAMVIEAAEIVLSEILGPAIAKKAKPLYIKNKILNIACLSSVMSQELNLKKPEIIYEINKKLGQDVVANLRLII